MRIAVREPSHVTAFAFYYDERSEDSFDVGRTFTPSSPARVAETVRYRVARASCATSRASPGRGPATSVTLFTFAADAEGNSRLDELAVRVTP